jgi:hypothetical protein
MRNRFIIALAVLTVLLITGFSVFWESIYPNLPRWHQALPIGLRESVDPFPEMRSFWWTTGAFAFFFLLELMVILLMDKKKKSISPRQSINLFLGLKVGKMILSLLFVAIYAMAVKIELKRFALVFAALYLIYLLFDTVYLMKKEKK